MSLAIIDDHELVGEGFAKIVRSEPDDAVSGIFLSAEDFLAELVAESLPDVCAVDLALPGMSRADLLRTVHARHCSITVLIVPAASRPDVAARCIQEGA